MNDTIRFPVRIPSQLHADLKTIAGEHERSLHGEIVYALKQYAQMVREEDDPTMRALARYEDDQ